MIFCAIDDCARRCCRHRRRRIRPRQRRIFNFPLTLHIYICVYIVYSLPLFCVYFMLNLLSVCTVHALYLRVHCIEKTSYIWTYILLWILNTKEGDIGTRLTYTVQLFKILSIGTRIDRVDVYTYTINSPHTRIKFIRKC